MAVRTKSLDIGFGFDPTESAHHFALIVPLEAEPGSVLIEERFTYGEALEPRCPEPRAKIESYNWSRVVHTVQSHFNRRLKDGGKKPSKFMDGENLLAPFLGKELALLFWALDDTDPTDLPNVLANWQGFVPEERWWLYSTVKGSGASPEEGRDRGWRKAIRIAFAENPAPPPAEGARGFAPDTLTLLQGNDEYAEEANANGSEPGLRKRKSRTTEPTLSLFE